MFKLDDMYFFWVSDSPHSSDDEETAMLKAELRRLRDKDYNEQKKALLRQMVEEERRAAARANAASSDGSSVELQWLEHQWDHEN